MACVTSQGPCVKRIRLISVESKQTLSAEKGTGTDEGQQFIFPLFLSSALFGGEKPPRWNLFSRRLFQMKKGGATQRLQ
jgi:hypothetical protein